MNIRRVVIVVVALLILGVGAGALWVAVAPYPTLDVISPAPKLKAEFPQPEAAKLFSGVAVFAFIAMGIGAVIALATWFGLRETRGVRGLSFAVVMSIAVSAIAMESGRQIAVAIRGTLDDAPVGDFRGTVHLWVDGTVGPPWVLLVCAPAVATLFYVACALSSSRADLGVGDGTDPDAQQEQVAVGQAAAVDGGGPESPASDVGTEVTSVDEGPRTRP